MPAAIPQEFQDEGRQLARILLDALSKAVHDLAAVNVAKLSSGERRRWAVQSIRMARMLATAFPQAIAEPADSPPKAPQRKALRKNTRAKAPSPSVEHRTPPSELAIPERQREESSQQPTAPDRPKASMDDLAPNPPLSARPNSPKPRPLPRSSTNASGRFVVRSLDDYLPPTRAAALADRILGPPDSGEPGA